MELNKQIQLNHSIVKEGITIAVLSGSLSIDSTNVGNISTSILNREYYVKFKSEVQVAIREFYNQLFSECDKWDALLNTNTGDSKNDTNEEVVDDIVEDSSDTENDGVETNPDATEDLVENETNVDID